MSSTNSSTPSGFSMSVKDYPKLHGQEDYRTWANAWEVAFNVLGLWDIVNGTIMKPEEQEEPEGSSSTTGKGKATATDIASWSSKNNLAKFYLYQAVDSTFHGDVSASETAHGIWQALKDRFDKETPATNMMLLEAIWKIKLSSGQNISDHVTKFETAWNRLAQRCANPRNSDGTTDQFRSVMKEVTQSEVVKGTIFMLSAKELHPDLCDMLAARKDERYTDVRDFFVSRAAEKSSGKEEEKVLFVPGNKGNGTGECTW
jgi:hypothetical protein